MPIQPIEFAHSLEYLSILDENGHPDTELVPDIPEEILLRLYRTMLLGRRFDERMLSLQRQGRIGTFPPVSGQEAAQLGAVALLRPSDWMVPSFRETAAEIWRGKPMENVLLLFGGYNEGGRIENDRNDLPVSIPVASQIVHAVGIGWAMKYRQTDDVVLTFFGDGATSEGDFHEGLNMAGVYQAPVVFVCQNNQWAISIPRAKQTHSETIAQKAIAYGIEGIQVDGNDILAVYEATRRAVERARRGEGPTLIECVTYRLMMHTTADDPGRYRSDNDVEEWRRKDPLPRFQTYLKSRELLSDKRIEQLETEIKAEIQAAVNRTESMMQTFTNPLDMFNHVYAELPRHLVAQKKELEQELAEGREEEHHG